MIRNLDAIQTADTCIEAIITLPIDFTSSWEWDGPLKTIVK